MSLRVGDKVLIRTNPPKWNGGKEKAVYEGEVLNLDPEWVKIRLADGEKIVVPLVNVMEIEILEAKESIFQKAFWIGLMTFLFIMEAIATFIGLVFLAGWWIKKRFRWLKIEEGKKKSKRR